mgnify:FL=1
MKIEMKKFGRILTSRTEGKEAVAVILSYMAEKNEVLELDFEGVVSVGPSWLDEVITVLYERLGRDKVMVNSNNPSVIESMKIILGDEV